MSQDLRKSCSSCLTSWNRRGKKRIRIKIQCPWFLKSAMFWLQQGMGTRGIGPGNRAFLEHGSYSASCVNGRLPFHTTMKNHKFQHFSGNNPSPWQTVSQSISQFVCVPEARRQTGWLCASGWWLGHICHRGSMTKCSLQPNPIHVCAGSQAVGFFCCLFF